MCNNIFVLSVHQIVSCTLVNLCISELHRMCAMVTLSFTDLLLSSYRCDHTMSWRLCQYREDVISSFKLTISLGYQQIYFWVNLYIYQLYLISTLQIKSAPLNHHKILSIFFYYLYGNSKLSREYGGCYIKILDCLSTNRFFS